MFFDRGTFWVLLSTYFYLPKSARAYLFPQSIKIRYFCSGPISVDPSCPQPSRAQQIGYAAERICRSDFRAGRSECQDMSFHRLWSDVVTGAAHARRYCHCHELKLRAAQVRAKDGRACALSVRNSHVSALCPVVKCPYLRTYEQLLAV